MVAIIGIPIGGDTDGGTLDGDPGRDHAVGPMQFIPSTWKRWSTDANGDGKARSGQHRRRGHGGRSLPVPGRW